MATIVTRHVVYSTASGRRNHHSITDMLNIYISSPGSYNNGNSVPINAPESKVHDGKIVNFAFAAVKGTSNGNHVYTSQAEVTDPANELHVGDNNIEVVVLYLPEGAPSGENTFFVDAFNVDICDFSNSDFTDVLVNGSSDASKKFDANEYGTINLAASAADVKAFGTVDSVPFKEWQKFKTGSSPSANLVQQLAQAETGVMFAFYLTPASGGGGIIIPGIDDYRMGWIYVSYGVKVDGGGFVIGPHGPVPVGPWTRFWVRVMTRISSVFNRGRAVSASDITSAAEQLKQSKAISQKNREY